MSRANDCPRCDGHGLVRPAGPRERKHGTRPDVTCPDCGGTGKRGPRTPDSSGAGPDSSPACPHNCGPIKSGCYAGRCRCEGACIEEACHPSHCIPPGHVKVVDPPPSTDLTNAVAAKVARRDLTSIAAEMLECASGWEPDVRLIGNVKADEIAAMARAIMADAAEITRLREALRRYGKHEPTCDVHTEYLKFRVGACGCGFHAALASPGSLIGGGDFFRERPYPLPHFVSEWPDDYGLRARWAWSFWP